MEMLFSAVMGEFATRSIKFLVDKCSNPTTPLSAVESLQRILLRVHVIVEEADGRHITNQGVLQQIDMLRYGMYRGYYVLDTFRYQSYQEEKVSCSFALSKYNLAKRLHLSIGSSGTQSIRELQQVIDSLNAMVSDVNESVVFLTSYSPLYRQPYRMHMFLDKCMVGRQKEMERIICFLLHNEPTQAYSFGVLPIVGEGKVGKSTLVAHVYNDERVRNYFSQIILLDENDLEDEKMTTLRDGGVIKHQNGALGENGRLLVVVELSRDVDEGAWRRLYSSSKMSFANDSKIIITSQSNKIIDFGTTQALKLEFLPQEVYWYFFKCLAFGSTDPEMQPKLASIAMEIARELNASFMGANITASFLRANFNTHFWTKVLTLLRGYIQNHLFTFADHPCTRLEKNKPTYIRRMGKTTEDCLIYHQYQTYFAQLQEVPKITFQDLMYGSAKIHGRTKVLAWRSQIPPYHCYIYSCRLRKLHHTDTKKDFQSCGSSGHG